MHCYEKIQTKIQTNINFTKIPKPFPTAEIRSEKK
jgi:hypothetical protein